MSVNKFINGELKMVAGLTPGSSDNIQYLTQEEYDALGEEKYENDIEYHITDGGINNIIASNIEYDNSISGLEATNVQGAVDELKNSLNDLFFCYQPILINGWEGQIWVSVNKLNRQCTISGFIRGTNATDVIFAKGQQTTQGLFTNHGMPVTVSATPIIAFDTAATPQKISFATSTNDWDVKAPDKGTYQFNVGLVIAGI